MVLTAVRHKKNPKSPAHWPGLGARPGASCMFPLPSHFCEVTLVQPLLPPIHHSLFPQLANGLRVQLAEINPLPKNQAKSFLNAIGSRLLSGNMHHSSCPSLILTSQSVIDISPKEDQSLSLTPIIFCFNYSERLSCSWQHCIASHQSCLLVE